MRVLLALVGVVGCTSGTGGKQSDGGGIDSDPNVPPYTQTLPDGPCSIEGVTGTVAGVTLAIRANDCVLRRGVAARFTYEVITDATVPAIDVPGSGGGCGDCSPPAGNPISWVSWSIGGTSAGGEQQRFCICDTGCCAPMPDATIQPTAMTETDDIEWSGRTWSGPSDTGNPMGDFFLPGRYDVFVTFSAYGAGSVQATLPIEIVLGP